MKKNLRTASICVQGGYEPKNGEPIEVPIYQSTTFKYDNSEEMAMLFDLKKEGYFYTRLQNPTNDVVAKKIAELEGGSRKKTEKRTKNPGTAGTDRKHQQNHSRMEC